MPDDFVKYKFLFDTADLGIVCQDSSGKIIEVNDAASEILGLTKTQLLNLSSESEHWQAIRENGKPIPGIEHPAMQALKTGKKIKDVVIGINHPGQKDHKWIKISAVPEFRKGEDTPYRVFTLFSDVTLEKETHQHLQLYQHAVEDSTNAVGMSTPEGKHYYQNRAFDELFGEIGINPPSTLYVDENVGREVFNTIMAGKEWSGDVEMYSRHGEILTIRLRAYAIKDSFGRVIGLVGVHSDVTEQLRAERELKESEAMLRIALEGAKADSWTIRLPTQEIIFSDSWADYFGYTKDEIPRTIEAVRKVIHPDDVVPNQERLETHLRGKSPLYESEVRIKNKNGDYTWVLIRGKIVEYSPEGIPLKLIGTSFDITEKQLTEKALRENEAKLNLALEGGLADSWEMFLPTREFHFTNKWAAYLGYKPKEIARTIDAIAELVHPEDHPISRINLEQYLKGETSVFESETRLRKKDGSYIWLLTRGKTVEWDKEGKPVRLTGVHFDITERKIAREELKLSEKKLKQNLNELEAIINALPGMVSVVDKDFNVLVANNEVIKRFGQSDPSEVLGKKCYETRKGLAHACPQCGLADAFRTGKTVTRVSTREEEELMGIATKAYSVPLYNEQDELWGGVEVIMDITDLRKAEETVLMSEKKFRHMIEHGGECITLIDAKGQVFYESPSVKFITGYTPEERIGKNALSLIYPEDLPAIKKILSTIAKTPGESLSAQFRAIKKDGRVWWVSGTVTNLLHDPNVSALVINYRDITRQKEAEISLRESELRFRTLIEHAADAVFLSDMNGRIVDVNHMTSEQTGYTREELLQKTVMEIDKDFPSLEACLKVWDALKMGESIKLLSYHLRKDGSIFPVEINTSPLEISGERHILGFVRDITERTRAEQAIRESEERFRRIFEEGLFGITIAGPDFKFITANPAFCEMLGYSVEELQKFTFAEITKADRVEEDRKRVMDMKEGRIKQIKTEKQYIRKDGTLIWGSLLSTTLRDAEGNVIYYLAMVKDISDLKQAEEALQKQIIDYQNLNKEYKAQNKELIQSLEQISRINKELETAKLKAEESDRLKTAFLANMSHEIRTPMNGILGFTDLLKQTDLSSNEHEKYIDIIQKSGYRMLNIINDLIDISKIEAGQVEIDISPTNINKVLDNFQTFFLPDANRRNIQLLCHKELSEQASIINTDETKLSQVLSNLIKNAMKYTSKGKIEFGYHLIDKKLQFYVEDTGTGIDPASKEIIFERFRQGYHDKEKAVEGSGLGLAISKAFLELMDGEIWLETAVGKGSKFIFTLPYIPVHKPEDHLDKPVELDLDGNVRTLLLAEDDESSRIYIEEIFKKYKVKLIHASDGAQAVALVQNNPAIDLVLMDIKMPVMGGLEATRKIKAIRSELPVIAQTAFASPIDNQKALDAGCDDYITKPLHRQLLLELVNKFLQLK